MPEGAGDVAAEFVAPVGREGGPALGGGEEDGEASAGGDVPEADRAVEAGGGEEAATGMEGDLRHGAEMALEGTEDVAGPHVPQPHRLILRSRGERLSIGTERY